MRKFINGIIRVFCKKYNFLRFFNKSSLKEIDFIINENCTKLKMFINLKDEGLSKELYCFRTREFENIKVFQSFIQKNENDIQYIIDIGSNIGFFLLIEDYLVQNKTILGIEPLVENYEILKKNINTFSSGKNLIKLYQFAVGNKDGLANFYVHKEKNRSSLEVSKDSFNIVETRQVKTINFSKFLESQGLKEKILMRMDIEGFEFEVFQNLNSWLKGSHKIFFVIEVHPHRLGNKIHQLIDLWMENNMRLEHVVFAYPAIYNFFLCKNNTFYKYHKQLGKKVFLDIIENVNKIKDFPSLKKFFKEKEISLHVFLSKK